MTKSKRTTQLPKSQKSPRSSVICGPMLTKLPSCASASNMSTARLVMLRRRPSTRKSTERLSAKREKRESKRRSMMNDVFIFVYLLYSLIDYHLTYPLHHHHPSINSFLITTNSFPYRQKSSFPSSLLIQINNNHNHRLYRLFHILTNNCHRLF